jgi:dephospho-CoA kinase
MRQIGLTGNIATGKSEVARQLQSLGAQVLDADLLAREVVAPGEPGLRQVREVFGPTVLKPDGSLDRQTLGRIVFNDPDKLAALQAITGPAVRERMNARLAALPPNAVAVLEVIRLFEAGYAEQCEQIWVTHCPPAVQIERLIRNRGMTEADAQTRVAAQNPQAEKLKRAHVIIDTGGDLEHTRNQVQRAWAAFVRRRPG